MKIITSQENLKKSLSIVDKIISKNTTLPILNNILLKTENGRLKISATNLEIGINYFIGAKIEEVGDIAVPARIFSDFINNLNEDKIILTTKNNILYINSSTYKTQILGFNPQDFPIIPKIKTDTKYSISAKIIKNSLATVFDSIAISETRPELAGVFMYYKDGKITFVATDSFRLTEKKTDFNSQYRFSVILPRSTVAELIRICGEIEDDVNISVQDNQISISNDDFELISRIIDGNYPDYIKIIPEHFLSKVLIKKGELEKNVRLAGLFSSNISDIKLSIKEDKIEITGKNSDRGQIEINLPCLLKNEPFDISLNFHYFLDGLKVIQTDDVIIEFAGTGSPLILKPNQEKPETLYLIMPLRTT